jgi:hypothetical protein
MRRKSVALVVATALVGSGVLIGAMLPAASQQATTIRLYERQRKGFEKFINVDGKKSMAGDYILESHSVYRVGTKRKVGRDAATITLIRRLGKQDALFRAAATFVLPTGRVEVSGLSKASRLAKGAPFAVIGGTGAYQGATGTLTVREGKYRTFFTFRLNP